MPTIAIAIVEDEPNELASLRHLTETWPGFHCTGAYRTAEAALKQIPLTNPDVVIMDLGLPRMDGIQCIWKLKQKHPRCEILVHSVEHQTRRVFEAIQAGASGYLLKGASPAELLAGVRDVLSGGSAMSPSIARLVFRKLQGVPNGQSNGGSLSQRETDVLRLLVQGYTNEEIAHDLGVCRDTVKTHIRHIYESLQLHSRAEVIAWWHEHRGAEGEAFNKGK